MSGLYMRWSVFRLIFIKQIEKMKLNKYDNIFYLEAHFQINHENGHTTKQSVFEKVAITKT